MKQPENQQPQPSNKEQLVAGMLHYLNSDGSQQSNRAPKIAEPKNKKAAQRRGRKIEEFSNTPSDNSKDVLKAKKRKELQDLKAMSEARRKPLTEELRAKK